MPNIFSDEFLPFEDEPRGRPVFKPWQKIKFLVTDVNLAEPYKGIKLITQIQDGEYEGREYHIYLNLPEISLEDIVPPDPSNKKAVEDFKKDRNTRKALALRKFMLTFWPTSDLMDAPKREDGLPLVDWSGLIGQRICMTAKPSREWKGKTYQDVIDPERITDEEGTGKPEEVVSEQGDTPF